MKRESEAKNGITVTHKGFSGPKEVSVPKGFMAQLGYLGQQGLWSNRLFSKRVLCQKGYKLQLMWQKDLRFISYINRHLEELVTKRPLNERCVEKKELLSKKVILMVNANNGIF